MPITRYTTQTIQDFVQRIIGEEGMAPHDRISIPRSTIFNRGDDAHGVWSVKMQRDYIDSILKGYPCGMICLVRDYGNAMTSYNAPSLILDGANKSRALRDFLWDKFTIPFTVDDEESPKLFSQLPESIKASFKTTQLSLCSSQIRRDEDEAIATMFTRLNTKQVPLSQGELIKAFSWRKNHIIPELAKNIIAGPIWNRHISEGVSEGSGYENHPAIVQNLTLIHQLQRKWAQSPLGVLGESTRLDNIALLCGMIIAIDQKNIYFYDKRFERLEGNLSDTLSTERVGEILMILEVFVQIMAKIYHKSIFGTLKKGMPSRKFASYIIYPLINGEINMVERRSEIQNMIKYFAKLRSDADLLVRFKGVVNFGGNNENSNSKFARVKTEIDNFISNYGSDEESELDESMILEVQQYIGETSHTNTVISSANNTAAYFEQANNTAGLNDGDFLLGADTATTDDDVSAVNNA